MISCLNHLDITVDLFQFLKDTMFCTEKLGSGKNLKVFGKHEIYPSQIMEEL